MKTFLKSVQNQSLSSKYLLGKLLLNWPFFTNYCFSAKLTSKIPSKSAISFRKFVPENPAKFDFFSATYQKPCIFQWCKKNNFPSSVSPDKKKPNPSIVMWSVRVWGSLEAERTNPPFSGFKWLQKGQTELLPQPPCQQQFCSHTRLCQEEAVNNAQDRVVQKPVNANPGLNLN